MRLLVVLLLAVLFVLLPVTSCGSGHDDVPYDRTECVAMRAVVMNETQPAGARLDFAVSYLRHCEDHDIP